MQGAAYNDPQCIPWTSYPRGRLEALRIGFQSHMHEPLENDAIQVRQMTELPFDPAKVLPSDLVDFIEPPELKEGESEQVYSIREAAANMLGVSVRVLEADTSGNIPGDEEINKIQRKAYLIENWLGEHCLQDLENYCFYLGGCKSTGNLLNDSDETAVKFPRRAFFKEWCLDSIGLDRPEWFKAEWDAAVERLAKSQIESEGGETAPKQEGADDLDASAQAQESEGAAPLSPQAADSLPGFNGGASGELCDGLTVEGVRKVFAKYPALRLLVKAAADVTQWPDGRTKDALTIVKHFEKMLKKFDDTSGEKYRWGRGDDGLSGHYERTKTQKQDGQRGMFLTLFTKQGDPGAPTKDANKN